MKTLPKLQIIGACCLLGLFTVTAYASGLPNKGPIPFTVYDQDGNGLISQQEFNSTHSKRRAQKMAAGNNVNKGHTPPSFANFDLNNDGNLNRTELHAGQREKMKQHQAKMKQQNRATPPNKPSFADFDLNGDGYILENEFYEARGKRRIEKSRQGYNLQHNIKKAPPFAKLDLNGDQKLTPDEFAKHLKRYQKHS